MNKFKYKIKLLIKNSKKIINNNRNQFKNKNKNNIQFKK